MKYEMKEKYCYESVKDDITGYDVPLFAAIILMVIAFIKRDSIDNSIFFAMLGISIFLFICWIGFYQIEGIVRANDTAVTFGRIFKKRIEYRSIRSINLSKEIRSYRTSIGYRAKSHRKYTRLVETITFHCEDGDHSFTCVLIPSHEYKSPGEPMSMYNNDFSNSTFTRLKNLIESKGNLENKG